MYLYTYIYSDPNDDCTQQQGALLAFREVDPLAGLNGVSVCSGQIKDRVRV